MKDLEVEHLLRQAASTDALSALQSARDIAARIHRREKRKMVLVPSGVLALVLGVAALSWRAITAPTPATIVRSSQESALSRATDPLVVVGLHERTAAALVLYEKQRRPNSVPDPLTWVQQQRDQAAMTLLRAADRALYDQHRADLAGNSYRQLIQLFPETSAAAVAQRRLGELPQTFAKSSSATGRVL